MADTERTSSSKKGRKRKLGGVSRGSQAQQWGSHEGRAPPASLHKYMRGPGTSTTRIKDKKLRARISRTEKKFSAAAVGAAEAEILLPEEAGFLEAEGFERTFKFKQEQIKAAVDVNTAREVFDLDLPHLGPYSLDYTRNGRYLLLGGARGHLAVLDALRLDVQMEIQLRETIRDVKALHNETLLAVAQRKYVYIYDNQGAEVHCLRTHLEPHRLEFLPYHFLLASIGRPGYLKYTDVSTGQLVAQMGTKLGACDCLHANPHNAVLHAGHHNGVVTMWSPAMGSPLVRMLAHRGKVTSLAVEGGGNYMVTSGQDAQTKVWDLRKYQVVHQYLTRNPPSTMDISQKGLLALGFGCHVQVWKDAISTKASRPYMEHHLPGHQLSRARFRPYQDVLGLGHEGGYSSAVVPGAGEPNFDTYEANPYETRKQRREGEVQALLDKLAPETIGLDPSFIGRVDKDPTELLKEQRTLMAEADTRTKKEKKDKKKTRGRNKVSKKLARKQQNVVDAGVAKRREKEKEKEQEEKRRKRDGGREEQRRAEAAKEAPAALARFFAK